jgi:hypothetical protein
MLRVVVLVLALFVMPAVAHAAEPEAVRAEIGKPLDEAKRLLAEKHYDAARGRLDAAARVKDKTPYESFVIEEMRAAIAAAAGDTATAIRAGEAMLAANRLAPAERLRVTADVAELYYRAKDYGRAVEWLQRYRAAGGDSPTLRWLLVDAFFAEGDCADAVREGEALLAVESETPRADRLQLLANCYASLKDDAAYLGTLERLVRLDPKPEYWTALVRSVPRKPGFAERLRLDLDRLALATGTMTEPAQYTDMAELALLAGAPGEAQAVLDQGYRTGILGTGPEAPRQAKLRDYAAQAVAEDRATLAQRAQQSGSRDAAAQLKLGVDFLGYGENDKAIALIQSALTKGRLAHPDDATIDLAIASLRAGRREMALSLLREVHGSDGTADLARLWSIFATERR